MSGKLVVGTDHGGFSDTGEEDERRLNLSGGQAMAGDVDNILGAHSQYSTEEERQRSTIDASLDPDVAILIADGTVSGVEVAGVGSHVDIEPAVVILPDGAGDRRPCVLEYQDSFDIVTFELLKIRVLSV